MCLLKVPLYLFAYVMFCLLMSPVNWGALIFVLHQSTLYANLFIRFVYTGNKYQMWIHQNQEHLDREVWEIRSLSFVWLVFQGLRTLELCVDNLQPDFLYDHIQPVRAELMQALWRTLRNPQDNIAHVAFRVLGKFGGGNRKMLREPQTVSDRCGVNVKIICKQCTMTQFCLISNEVKC